MTNSDLCVDLLKEFLENVSDREFHQLELEVKKRLGGRSRSKIGRNEFWQGSQKYL